MTVCASVWKECKMKKKTPFAASFRVFSTYNDVFRLVFKYIMLNIGITHIHVLYTKSKPSDLEIYVG